jgi:hypothetical protein
LRRAIARGELKASRACGLRVLASDAAAWWTDYEADHLAREVIAEELVRARSTIADRLQQLGVEVSLMGDGS